MSPRSEAWATLCMSAQLTGVEALHAFAARRAKLALLEALAVLFEAVRALAGAALLGGRGVLQRQLFDEGGRVLAERVLDRLVSELLVSPPDQGTLFSEVLKQSRQLQPFVQSPFRAKHSQ